MTVNIENNADTQLPQDKVDTNPNQPKVESNVSQTPEENKEIVPNEDPNWKAFREARKKDRQDREIAQRKALEKEAEVAALKAAMEAAFSKSPPQQQNYQNDYGNEETEDERIDKRVQAALELREKAIERERLEREHREYPDRLVKSFPDFNHMIAQENLDYLDYHYPEVSRPLQRLHDGYDKWSDIYHAVKKFVPNATTHKKDAARAEANFNKPRSISSTGLTQHSDSPSSHILTEDRKASNWERMQKSMKGLG